MIDVIVGEYRVQQDATGRLTVQRHGLPWQDYTGDGLVCGMAHEIERLREAVEEMDRIHQDIMTGGPRCTCGDGDEWCERCGMSIRLSGLASAALKF